MLYKDAVSGITDALFTYFPKRKEKYGAKNFSKLSENRELVLESEGENEA